MPLYQLQCQSCSVSEEQYLVRHSDPNPACRHCAGATERVWQGVQRGAVSVFPYVTTHLTGKPLEIKDAGHLRQLEKQHGVRLRDDSAFTEQRWEGYDFRNKRHRYTEGSGRGLPGSWV